MKIASALYHSTHYEGMYTVESPRHLEGADLLVLHGGADIATSLYNAKVGMSQADELPSRRDALEMALVRVAVTKKIPILGICRGAQLLCAMQGGSLWQHVQGHQHGQHELIFNGKSYVTNSCHHQMMIPPESAEVLAYAPLISKKKWKDGKTDPIIVSEEKEPEIVFFPHIKAIGVQGHPEWLNSKDDLNIITNQLVGELLNVNLQCRG